MSLVVKSKIKDVASDVNIAGDFAEALNKKIEALVLEACERCKANGRKTVQSRDL